MDLEPGRAPSCGAGVPDEAAGGRSGRSLDGSSRGGPCNCLPGARADWVSCAACGLPQAPGKDFCGFCGSRWVTAGEPGQGATT